MTTFTTPSAVASVQATAAFTKLEAAREAVRARPTLANVAALAEARKAYDALIGMSLPGERRSWLRRRALPVVALLGLLALSPVAQADSGNELLEHCTDMTGWFGRGYCVGYVAATVDAIFAVKQAYGREIACLPNGTTKGQAMDVVVQYLIQHPATRNYMGEPVAALAQAFPCKH